MPVRQLRDREVRKIRNLLVKSRNQSGLSSFDRQDLMRLLRKTNPGVDSMSKREVIEFAWELVEERDMGSPTR